MTEKKCPKGQTRVSGRCRDDEEVWSKKIDLKEGALQAYEWAKDAPESVRHKGLDNLVEDESYQTAIQRLQYLINISKDAETVRTATDDRNYLQGKRTAKKKKRYSAALMDNKDMLIPLAVIGISIAVIIYMKKTENSTYESIYARR